MKPLDDSALLESPSGMLAMVLVLVGFALFLAAAMQGYDAYEERQFAVRNARSVAALAESLRSEPLLRGNTTALDAERLARLAGECPRGECGELLRRYGAGFNFSIRVEAPGFVAVLRQEGGRPRAAAAVTLPVTLHLNPVEDVDAAMTVVAWRRQ